MDANTDPNKNEDTISGNAESRPTPATQPAAASPQPQLINSAPSSSAVVSGGNGTAPTVSDPAPATVVASTPGGASPDGRSKKRWLVPAVIIAVLVVLVGGGVVFGYVIPNQPKNVFSSSLTNSGKAVDKLTSYATDQSKVDYKSASFDGTAKYGGGSGGVEASFSGSFDKDANGSAKVAVDLVGQKVNAEIRSVHASGNNTPDVYVQVSGVKSILDGYGLSSFDSLDSKWIAIDHTLIDSYASSQSSALGSGLSSSTQAPTTAQVQDAVSKLQTVNKDYLFTTDNDKAVFQYKSFEGKETMDGRSVNHYKVDADKAHLKSYVGALKTALDSSKLNDWSKKANDGKSLSEVIDFDNLTTSIDKLDASKPIDVYVDKSQKLIHAIKFTDPDGSTFQIAQKYTGGDEYPFVLTISGKENGETTTGSLGMTLNMKSNKVAVTGNFDQGSNKLSLNMNITPSKDAVTATAPSGATPILTVLNQLGLGSGTVSGSTNSLSLSQ